MISLMPNTSMAIQLDPAERTQLEKWESSYGTPQQVALRCRIILGALAGQDNVSIAEHLGVSRPTVQLCRKRVSDQGIGQVWEIAPGRGRKPQYDQATRDKIIQATLRSKPKGMTHWSCRLMAEAQEVSKNTVNRLWQLHNLKPHLSRTFKLSRDAKFLEKLTDVVGLYLNPPDKTLVLCLDEKSQIQALDRTQPGLPLKKGRCGTMTHDYKRNGTTTLFAAMNVLDGKVIGECHSRHRHQEWLKFLMAMSAMTLTDHLAVQDVHRRKQCGGAIAFVVVRHRTASAFLQGQPRLGPIQRLNLALFIQTQHERLVGRVQIQPHHIGQLLQEFRIPRQLKGAAQVRLEIVQLPQSVHCVLTDLLGLCHEPATPMGHALGLATQGRLNA